MADLNTKMNDQVPFAVVGSRDEVVVNGHKVRARQYPWGTVEGELCVCYRVYNAVLELLLGWVYMGVTLCS